MSLLNPTTVLRNVVVPRLSIITHVLRNVVENWGAGILHHEMCGYVSCLWNVQDYSSWIVLYLLQVGCHIMRTTKLQRVTIVNFEKTKADTSVAVAVFVRNQ